MLPLMLLKKEALVDPQQYAVSSFLKTRLPTNATGMYKVDLSFCHGEARKRYFVGDLLTLNQDILGTQVFGKAAVSMNFLLSGMKHNGSLDIYGGMYGAVRHLPSRPSADSFGLLLSAQDSGAFCHCLTGGSVELVDRFTRNQRCSP
jgi:hypothetical protein